MLSKQEEAWAVYAAIFLFFTIILTLRCRNNVFLIPFAVFGFLVTLGSIFLTTYRKDYTTALASGNMAGASEDHYWISKSLVLSFLPAASVLVFGGIMEAQLIFIRHIAAAIYNRDHWGSMYLRDPEKQRQPPRKKTPSLRPWNYWTSLLLLVLFTLIALCSVLIETIIPVSETSKNLSIAICTTVLCVIAWSNVSLIWYTSSLSIKHIRMIRQNRDDMLFLRITPILFSISLMGMVLLTWLYFASVTIPLPAWILLESLLVYCPLAGILVMCIYTGKIKKMGRQYGAEPAQRSFNNTPPKYATVVPETESSSEDEKKGTTSPPPPAYQPDQSHHYH
ncbi:uncharacterized protein B0P05DRAFT_556521 [Gilbertella persicaria]|uniref:uncharacterized protein n=1 Tax=Gilbertella persicaria TaxID=101096 RepID=UPI00222053D7|nr:uncharacterized protein B0P05DRAFT_556521 [Gilbertella persicaria]KAI8062315.1 hypothetical protein B0P05DRAFT_556521 [Gilbertella persicaria]